MANVNKIEYEGGLYDFEDAVARETANAALAAAQNAGVAFLDLTQFVTIVPVSTVLNYNVQIRLSSTGLFYTSIRFDAAFSTGTVGNAIGLVSSFSIDGEAAYDAVKAFLPESLFNRIPATYQPQSHSAPYRLGEPGVEMIATLTLGRPLRLPVDGRLDFTVPNYVTPVVIMSPGTFGGATWQSVDISPAII